MADVFVSYNNRDEKYVLQLLQALGDKFSFWAAVANLEGGIKWSDAIDEALRESYLLIVILTPNSVVSQWVTYEWAYALGTSKPVIPLKFEEIDESQIPIHDKLKEIQIESFLNPQLSDWHKLEQLVQKHMPRGMHAKFDQLSETIRDQSRDWNKHFWAIIELRTIPDSTLLSLVAPDLIRILRTDEQFLNRSEAAKTLAKINSRKVVDALIEALTSDDTASVRRGAAESLGILGDKRAVPELIKSLYDVEHVRTYAARALGALKDTSSINELRVLLADHETRVRVGAAQALGAIGPHAEAAVPELVELLNDNSTYHPRARVCDVAADALRRIRNLDGLRAVRNWELASE